MKLRIIILCSYLLVGLVIGYAIHFPEEVIVEKVVTVENFSTTLPDDAPVISYNEALGIIDESKDSHLIYKGALQE